MSEKTTYRIIRFEAENLKRIQAVQVTPEGNLVELTGRNGNGKSSILDAIFFALGGKSAIPAKPIREGEQVARVFLDMGELKVTLRLTLREDGSYAHVLIVESADGARYASPQAILDALVGALAFDPIEFTRMKAKEQFDTLRRFVIGFDFDVNTRDRKRAFDDRTDVNRDLKNLKSQVAGIAVPNDTPDAEIDVTALTAELQKVGEHNASIEQRKANREKVADEAVRFRAEADSYEVQAADYRRLADEADAKAVEMRAKADDNDKRLAAAGALPSPMDAGEIRAKIDRANVVNAAVRDKVRRDKLIAEAHVLEQQSTSLTNEIERLDAVKATAIAGANMPIDGLGFAEDYVTLNGLPFNQASSAEQLRASIAIAIASNPRLRVLIVRDGALLDNESMQIVAEMAEKNDVQVWIETVTSGRPSALVIEDGRIRGEEVPAVAAE